jgi:septum formation protein
LPRSSLVGIRMVPTRSLILASTSSYRRMLLERLGVPFTVRAPDCDEDAFKEVLRSGAQGRASTAGASQELAERLALEKALSVARHEPDSFVIGSDQVVDLAGEILGKPGSASAAEDQLSRMSGREHQLITALAICGPNGVCEQHTDVTRMRMRRLSGEEIARYVAQDRPLDCAGSYKIECLGIALFERIECADHNAIAGLPLLALSQLLRQLGFAIP